MDSTATELLAAMGETETIPTVITKWLNEYRTTFFKREPYLLPVQPQERRQADCPCKEGGWTAVMVVTAILGYPPVTVIALKAM